MLQCDRSSSARKNSFTQATDRVEVELWLSLFHVSFLLISETCKMCTNINIRCECMSSLDYLI